METRPYTVPDEFETGLKFVFFRLFTREFVLLSRFSTSEFFRAKRPFSFDGIHFATRLADAISHTDKGKRSLRAREFASGKPALGGLKFVRFREKGRISSQVPCERGLSEISQDKSKLINKLDKRSVISLISSQ
jgi:hypothetical protein